MRKIIFWGGFTLVFIVGGACRFFDILPVQNTTLFLLGLMWLWNSFTLVIKFNPVHMKDYSRRKQLISAALIGGMSIAWILISLTEAHRSLWLVLAVTLIFLIPGYFVTRKHN